MKILGFAGSNSSVSINKKLVEYAATLFQSKDVEILDLNDFEVELYKTDREERTGIPAKILVLAEKISTADCLVISLAEHNGSYSASFKNIYDWISRIPNRKVFDGKPILLMATSPGGRGGESVLAAAEERFPRNGGEVKAVFSLPSFHESFDKEKNCIRDSEKNSELKKTIKIVERKIAEQSV